MRAVPCLVALALGCGRANFDPVGDGREPDAVTVMDGRTIPAAPVVWLSMDSSPPVDMAGAHTVNCGTCPTPVPGVRGGALRFDGSQDSFLTIPYTPDLDASAGYTVAAWLQLETVPTGNNNYACAISKPLLANDRDTYSLCIDSMARVLYYSASSTGDDYTYGAAVNPGGWHHVAMSWDGTTKTGYLDGVATAVMTATHSDDHDILIGADANTGSTVYRITGAMDDVFLYTRALSAQEIAQLMR